MKITVSQLRRIIKEEVSRALNESLVDDTFVDQFLALAEQNATPGVLKKIMSMPEEDLKEMIEAEVSSLKAKGYGSSPRDVWVMIGNRMFGPEDPAAMAVARRSMRNPPSAGADSYVSSHDPNKFYR